MQQMIDSLQSSMRLLVASVRSPDDIVALASQAGPVAAETLLRPLLELCHSCALFWSCMHKGDHRSPQADA